MSVAVLCVHPKGPYPRLVASHLLWDEARDARGYDLDLPVVAHPPCGPWGNLRALCHKQDAGVGPACVAHVRRCGGVLEHPAGSSLFRSESMPPPGGFPDPYGGVTYQTTLAAFGATVMKPTWLYVVGLRQQIRLPFRAHRPSRTVESLSTQARQITPEPMARFLLDLASMCRRCA